MSKIASISREIPLSFFIILFLSLPFKGNSQTANGERTILLKLKQLWGNTASLQFWNSSSEPCKWPAIYCSGDSVSEISLPSENINGTIPPFICDLQNLTYFDLSNNNIPGEFPTVLYNCSKLQVLDLSLNYFEGQIPEDFYRISRLQYLNLGGNTFAGQIPAAVGRFAELQTLFLYVNEFNGSFPSNIGNLSNLEFLGLAYNNLLVPARIPWEFGRLKKLTYLWMADTNLIGEIPESITNLSNLERLDLSRNALIGKIPSDLLLLKNLSYLYLFNNRLSGEIPRSVKALKLIEIDLSKNTLTGPIPEDFGKLQNLTVLNLFINRLSGEIPTNIGRIPTLRDIRLFENNLMGVLPPELGLHSNLEAFEVSSNKLTGNLPENLCANSVLHGVVAFSNNFSGELPKSLRNCDSLRTVQVYNNSISGQVPTRLWSAFNLSGLMISNNLFSGQLPGNFEWSLTRLEISNNRFYGEIPVRISASNLVVFEASNNQFSGKIPMKLTGLPLLTTLLLDGNQLSGNLPSEIISWNSLTTLNLRKNELFGEIPPSIGYLPNLLDLDLSENKFSGQIPPEIGRLRLTSFNLSSNHLTGRIPDEFENLAYVGSFFNNPGLCAANPFPNIQSCHSKPRNSRRLSHRYLVMILVLSVAVVLVSVLIAFFVIQNYQRRKHAGNLVTWKMTSFQRVEFTESSILSSLTDNNLIGSGGSGKVYRFAINRSGEAVAVKKICNIRKLDQKLEKEFLAEAQILGSIRHPNIVKLLCCMSSEESKLLVYEYMENSSLDRWLHGRKRSSSVSGSVDHVVLDWPRRLQIAVGAARGLCYMHHDCSPSIIHRDVKSGNILLDSEFNAKIADFGLARTLVGHGEPDTMSAVAGSFGYLAPEYVYTTKVNEKVDVYCFGVVLLELATGREASNRDDEYMLAEWAWRYLQDGNSIADALYEKVKEPCYLDEMSAVFNLGIICTATLPSKRPSMKEVLQILLRCGPLQAYGENKAGNDYDAAPLLTTTDCLSNYGHSRRRRTSEDVDNLACIVCVEGDIQVNQLPISTRHVSSTHGRHDEHENTHTKEKVQSQEDSRES